MVSTIFVFEYAISEEVYAVKNITLSADEKLIEAACARAQAEHTTLDEQFRHWLADYARLQRYDQVISALRGKVRVGRKLTRDEMHER
jgi:hypothetical protein